MNILIIDRDSVSSQLLKSKLEPMGHHVIVETVKNNAVDLVGQNDIDLVFVDPSPLTDPRPIILGIKRAVTTYSYIVVMSEELDLDKALRTGANDFMKKPFDPEEIKGRVENARRMNNLVMRLGDDSEDFPSAGGVIAKSAFNQLFLSAIDRADRYGEFTHVIFITMDNYEDIKNYDGPYAAEYAASKMAQYLVRLRRQSDIIAQTGANEYALMLLRPQTKTEPFDAAARFATSLEDYKDIKSDGSSDVQIGVRLIDLPIGNLQSEAIVKF